MKSMIYRNIMLGRQKSFQRGEVPWIRAYLLWQLLAIFENPILPPPLTIVSNFWNFKLTTIVSNFWKFYLPAALGPLCFFFLTETQKSTFFQNILGKIFEKWKSRMTSNLSRGIWHVPQRAFWEEVQANQNLQDGRPAKGRAWNWWTEPLLSRLEAVFLWQGTHSAGTWQTRAMPSWVGWQYWQTTARSWFGPWNCHSSAGRWMPQASYCGRA